MIYTSYYAKQKLITQRNIVPIAISLYVPKWYTGLSYSLLAPTKDTLFGDKSTYINNYIESTLRGLNPNEVIKDLYELSNDNDIALLCYETPEKFCHRHIVAKWLSKFTSEQVIEIIL